MRVSKVDTVYFILIAGVLVVGVLLLVRLIQGNAMTPSIILVWAGILAVLCVLRLFPHKFKRNILMLLASTLFTIYLVEFILFAFGNPFDGLRTADGSISREWAARFAGVEFDTREPLAVVNDLQGENITAVPFLPPSNSFATNPQRLNNEPFHPLSGIANTTTVYCNESGQYVLYDSDQYGFNNPTEAWDNLPLQVALVGDSFAQGACVKQEDSLAGLLRKRYPATVTLGMNSNGPFSVLASIKEYLGPHNPEVIVWLWFEGNDMGKDMPREKQSDILTAYLDSTYTQNLVERQQDVDQVVQKYVDDVALHIERTKIAEEDREPQLFRASLKLFNIRSLFGLTLENPEDKSSDESEEDREKEDDQLRSLFYRRAKSELDPSVREDFKFFSRILSDTYWYSSGWEPELLFVYVPHYHRLTGEITGGDALSRDFVMQSVRESNWQLLDLYPMLSEHPDPMSLYPFGINGHFNEDGYAVMADAVMAEIEDDVTEREENAETDE